MSAIQPLFDAQSGERELWFQLWQQLLQFCIYFMSSGSTCPPAPALTTVIYEQ